MERKGEEGGGGGNKNKFSAQRILTPGDREADLWAGILDVFLINYSWYRHLHRAKKTYVECGRTFQKSDDVS